MSGEFEHLPAAIVAFFGIALFVALPLFVLIAWALKRYYAWEDREHARRMEEKLRQSFLTHPPRPWDVPLDSSYYGDEPVAHLYDEPYDDPVRHIDVRVLRIRPNGKQRR